MVLKAEPTDDVQKRRVHHDERRRVGDLGKDGVACFGRSGVEWDHRSSSEAPLEDGILGRKEDLRPAAGEPFAFSAQARAAVDAPECWEGVQSSRTASN